MQQNKQISVHLHTLNSPILYLSAATNTASECSEQSIYTPLVVVAISAANTLLLLISLATFVASCAVLCRAKRSRQKHTVHDYEMADDEVKGQMVQDDSDIVSVQADIVDLHLPTQLQYQTLQTHTLQNHQYATVTGHPPS